MASLERSHRDLSNEHTLCAYTVLVDEISSFDVCSRGGYYGNVSVPGFVFILENPDFFNAFCVFVLNL